ncbi:hypothetical protein [Haloplanus rubicundus]|uniref:hypothetical protein n=1 Tax=Haloplanus rubicundus TaxID=1547898 RepID=UPI0013005183|nr:hypothetical protein [Haloplanus rubicundus]
MGDYFSNPPSIDGGDAEQTKVDIYSEATTMKAEEDVYFKTVDNYLNDSETVAWSKAQVAIAEAYQNGSTQATARYEAEKAIEEYYAVKQRNLASRWNVHVDRVQYLHDAAENESGIDQPRFFSQDLGADYDLMFQNGTVTLVNGTSIDARVLRGTFSGNPEDTVSLTTDTNNGYSPDQIYVDAPTSAYNQTTAIDAAGYTARFAEIENKRDSLVAEVQTYVNATYDDYESGNINASDVISSQTAMFEYGTVGTNESSSLYDAVGALALSGYDTPNLNGTGTMDVRYDNQTYTGLVMAHNVPGGSWSVNSTYNTSNIDGPVFITTTDGTKVDIPEGETFTIEAIRAQDGSSISSVNTTVNNYKTANASELKEVQEQLTALRAEIEERETSSGAGGGSGGIGGNTMLIVLAAVAAAAIALGSQNGGGRQGRGRR